LVLLNKIKILNGGGGGGDQPTTVFSNRTRKGDKCWTSESPDKTLLREEVETSV